jgi:signal transduction histidine kinase
MDTAEGARPDSASAFLAGGGELGAMIRAFDWSGTPIGPASAWPQGLKTAVRIMLTSRQPFWVGWGEELTYLYNDAYKSIIGGKHPWALGRPTQEVWREIWPDIEPLLATAMGGVEGTYVEAQLLIMERNGYPEETYYTFSYSPIPDDDGKPGGIICANTDDTQRVIGERQLAVLQELAARTFDARSWEEASQRAVEALATNPRDLTFVLLYVAEPGADTVSLIASVGLEGVEVGASLPLADAFPWPIAAVMEGHEALVVDDLAARLGAAPSGAWDRPSTQAVLLPIALAGEASRTGVLVVGLNPFRLFDDGYEGFLGLVAGQVSSAIASADAYEKERRRVEALAELDRAKTAFFSNVSHEFRTPLTLMLGPLEEALAGEAPPEDLRAHLELARRNGARLLRLVNTLLDFSRIEAGRVEASFEPVEFAGLTAELASSFRSAVEKAGLFLDVHCDPVGEPVFVDRDMLEKIVLNLISNAFKFTLHGGIHVAVAADRPAGRVRLTVRDTGIGIPAAELPRLFERFHRVEGAKGRSFEGSGIGLALVQELVRLHGGEISVESTVGAGSTFTVTLPLGSDHLPADRVAQPASHAGPSGRVEEFAQEAMRWLPEAPPDFELAPAGLGDAPRETRGPRGKLVLLADDNADMRAYVRRLLEAQGYSVLTAADGEAALAIVRERKPDLVLTDVMMPVLDGFGLLRAVRGDAQTVGVPVIMLSARAGEDAEVEGLEAGADDYLVKPFSARELVARVSANIRLAEVRREANRALEELNATLEQRIVAEVAQRTRTEEALRQAQKMEVVGQLTGGVAHDFNNLLTVIIGGLDTIRRSPNDQARVLRSTDMALQGAQRAVSLTSRLLAFSRRQPLEPRPLEPNVLLRDMSQLLQGTLGEQVELECVHGARLWRIEADQNQLATAILNLVVNARDAMPDGGKLTIETANTELDESYAATDAEVVPGQYVALAVSDTGVGMSKDTLTRVFEPFFTTKEAGRGTGLGLSMVYGFVKQSGGHVTIYSEVGQGTTVKLYFPRYLGDAPVSQPREKPQAVGADAGETILVVEDNDDVREYAIAILTELGYRVLEAADADAALLILQSEGRIDVLFTDVVLPGKSGRVLADEASRLRPDLKVLYATGYSRNAIVHHGRLDPGVHLITKPFTFDQLAARIRGLLDGGGK